MDEHLREKMQNIKRGMKDFLEMLQEKLGFDPKKTHISVAFYPDQKVHELFLFLTICEQDLKKHMEEKKLGETLTIEELRRKIVEMYGSTELVIVLTSQPTPPPQRRS